MKCLRCNNVEMVVQTKGEGQDLIEIDVCGNCDGIWLDAMELSQLDDNFFINMEDIEYLESKPTAADTELVCPRCTKQMTKVHPKGFSNVVLDTCHLCKGFWLDRGELEKIRDISDQMLVASLLD